MNRRRSCIVLAAAVCVLPVVRAQKPGDPAPDLSVRTCHGAEARLSEYRHKKHVALLATAPGSPLAKAVLEDACRRIDALEGVVLLEGDAANRRLLENTPLATILIDSEGVVRRVVPARVLTGAGLADFVSLWLSGKLVFETACARCHGLDGENNICLDVKPLAGIGKRYSEPQIREKLRPGIINDRDVLVRGQIFSRQEVDAVIAYVAGL